MNFFYAVVLLPMLQVGGRGAIPLEVVIQPEIYPLTASDFAVWSVDFNQNVASTFTAADITVMGTLAPGASVAVAGSSPNFLVAVVFDDMDADGTCWITIGPNVGFAPPFAGATSPQFHIDHTILLDNVADVNRDGTIDIADVALLADYNLGVVTLM